jgi:hypothetical protein
MDPWTMGRDRADVTLELRANLGAPQARRLSRAVLDLIDDPSVGLINVVCGRAFDPSVASICTLVSLRQSIDEAGKGRSPSAEAWRPFGRVLRAS